MCHLLIECTIGKYILMPILFALLLNTFEMQDFNYSHSVDTLFLRKIFHHENIGWINVN